MLYGILNDLFGRSQYLHSVGVGDEQAITDLLSELLRGDAMLDGDTDSRWLDILAGALAARAMVRFEEAYAAAEELYFELEAVDFDMERLDQ